MLVNVASEKPRGVDSALQLKLLPYFRSVKSKLPINESLPTSLNCATYLHGRTVDAPRLETEMKSVYSRKELKLFGSENLLNWNVLPFSYL